MKFKISAFVKNCFLLMLGACYYAVIESIMFSYDLKLMLIIFVNMSENQLFHQTEIV